MMLLFLGLQSSANVDFFIEFYCSFMIQILDDTRYGALFFTKTSTLLLFIYYLTELFISIIRNKFIGKNHNKK